MTIVWLSQEYEGLWPRELELHGKSGNEPSSEALDYIFPVQARKSPILVLRPKSTSYISIGMTPEHSFSEG